MRPNQSHAKSAPRRLGVRALMIGIPSVRGGARAPARRLLNPVRGAGADHRHSRSHISYGQELVAGRHRSPADAGHTVALSSRRGARAPGAISARRRSAAPARFAWRTRSSARASCAVLDTTSGSLTPFVRLRAPARRRGDEHARACRRRRPACASLPANRRSRRPGRIGPRSAGAGRRRAQGEPAGAPARRVAHARHDAYARHGPVRAALRHRAAPARQPIRVRFAGDQLNARFAGRRRADDRLPRRPSRRGTTTAAKPPAGSTPSYGVANRTLPCGTTVDVPLRRPLGDRDRRRPRTVRRRSRLGPQPEHRGGARLRRRRHRSGRASNACDRWSGW